MIHIMYALIMILYPCRVPRQNYCIHSTIYYTGLVDHGSWDLKLPDDQFIPISLGIFLHLLYNTTVYYRGYLIHQVAIDEIIWWIPWSDKLTGLNYSFLNQPSERAGTLPFICITQVESTVVWSSCFTYSRVRVNFMPGSSTEYSTYGDLSHFGENSAIPLTHSEHWLQSCLCIECIPRVHSNAGPCLMLWWCVRQSFRLNSQYLWVQSWLYSVP